METDDMSPGCPPQLKLPPEHFFAARMSACYADFATRCRQEGGDTGDASPMDYAAGAGLLREALAGMRMMGIPPAALAQVCWDAGETLTLIAEEAERSGQEVVAAPEMGWKPADLDDLMPARRDGWEFKHQRN